MPIQSIFKHFKRAKLVLLYQKQVFDLSSIQYYYVVLMLCRVSNPTQTVGIVFVPWYYAKIRFVGVSTVDARDGVRGTLSFRVTVVAFLKALEIVSAILPELLVALSFRPGMRGGVTSRHSWPLEYRASSSGWVRGGRAGLASSASS